MNIYFFDSFESDRLKQGMYIWWLSIFPSQLLSSRSNNQQHRHQSELNGSLSSARISKQLHCHINIIIHYCLGKIMNAVITHDLWPHYDFLCPDDPIRTPTAIMNINNMLTSRMYVFRDDLLYSPKTSTPQNVLTSGSAW